jgi:hypothetical protein
MVLGVTEISAMVAAVGVLVGVVYYALEMRHQSRTRDTDLVLRLYSTASSKDFEESYTQVMSLEFKDYDDFVTKYGKLGSHAPLPIAVDMVCSFYEELGVLYHRKLIDMNLVHELFSVRRPWTKIKPIAEGARKQLNEPTLYAWFEYLYNEMQKRGLQELKA